MRTELLRGRVSADLKEAQTAIDAWVDEYNHRRPHQSLQMATPAERFRTEPDHRIPEGLLEPSGKPPDGQLVIERWVAQGGIISVAEETFSVGGHLGPDCTCPPLPDGRTAMTGSTSTTVAADSSTEYAGLVSVPGRFHWGGCLSGRRRN